MLRGTNNARGVKLITFPNSEERDEEIDETEAV